MQLKDLFTNIFKVQYQDPALPETLKDVVKKYPYFAVPHFFLLKSANPATGYYNHIAARTALFFDNPYLLQLKLDEPWEEDDEKFTGLEIAAKQKSSVETHPEDSVVDTEQLLDDNKNITKETPQIVEEPVQQPLEKVDVKTEPVASEPMIFEPLFATDYFASQGIKLSEEVQPGDKLGKQLKSFTEWLKSMKKVHDEKQPAGNVQIDLAVQNLAEKSNVEEDVITESMAEAYLQQGKKGKAIEIYEKLSLLNPAKSAYFAAKIDGARSK